MVLECLDVALSGRKTTPRGHAQMETRGDGPGQAILKLENSFNRAVQFFACHHMSGAHVREAGRDANDRPQALKAARQDPAAAEKTPYLQRIKAAKNTQDLITLFAAPGFDSPLGFDVDPDPKQSDRYALRISQAGLGLPDRDYYLQDTPRYVEIRQKYLDYLTFLLGKAGYTDTRAQAEAVLLRQTETIRSRATAGSSGTAG